jgi:hypothetical protein
VFIPAELRSRSALFLESCPRRSVARRRWGVSRYPVAVLVPAQGDGASDETVRAGFAGLSVANPPTWRDFTHASQPGSNRDLLLATGPGPPQR